jgi:putative peptidoglycan lipid II flippase
MSERFDESNVILNEGEGVPEEILTQDEAAVAGGAETANRQIARGAVVVMGAFVLSNVLSLARQILSSQTFGASATLDAFYAAMRLEEILFNLVAGGALASAFIPTLAEFLEKDDRKGAWQLTSAILNLVTIVLGVASVLIAIFAPVVVRYVLAPGYGAAQRALTVELLRIVMLAPAIFGISGLLMGVMNSHQKFLLPALAPSMNWIGQIIGLVFLVPSMGIYGFAWGAVLGAVLHLLVQLPGVIRLPAARYWARLGLKDKAVQQVGRLMGPRVLGVAIVQLNFLVNTMISSGLSEGALSAVTLGFGIMMMPQLVIAQGIAIAALPTFSALVARNELDDMRSSLASVLRMVVLLSVPASVGLIVLRVPIVAMAFERQNFTAENTQMVAWALLWYAVGLVSHSLLEILSRAFYALHDTKTPVTVGVIAMGLNLVFSLIFPGMFEGIGWLALGGLALANSLATTIEVVVLFVLMRRKLGGMNAGRIVNAFWKAAIGVAWMALIVRGWEMFYDGNSVWVLGLGGIVLGVVMYVVMMFVLRVDEAFGVARTVLGRLRGRE